MQWALRTWLVEFALLVQNFRTFPWMKLNYPVIASDSSSSQHKIVVSIINYRTAEMTIRCVQSVLDDLAGIDGHVVIVDNQSGDGSAEKIEDWISSLPQGERVSFVQSPTNSGFSGGHNQGMAARAAEFMLVLNSDAIVRPGFLGGILDAADANPGIGFFAPCIEYDDGEQQISCFRFPSIASEFMRGAQSGPVSRLFARRQVALQMPPSDADIEWASFACILLRSAMVRQVGPMDEGYFLYFEDVEYCWRARQEGWRITYVPKARAVHFRGGSGPVKTLVKQRKRLPGYYYASRTRLFRQLYGSFGPCAANLAWLSGRLVARLRLLAGRKIPPSNKKEFQDIWTNFLSPLGDSRSSGH